MKFEKKLFESIYGIMVAKQENLKRKGGRDIWWRSDSGEIYGFRIRVYGKGNHGYRVRPAFLYEDPNVTTAFSEITGRTFRPLQWITLEWRLESYIVDRLNNNRNTELNDHSMRCGVWFLTERSDISEKSSTIVNSLFREFPIFQSNDANRS